MIISRTPYRVSFFGGGTDYPEWFESNGGAVVASAINKYAYIICQRTPRFVDYRYRISYRNTEIVSNIDEIQHPAVREAIRLLGIPYGIELNHHGDLLARSGVGSSSAFAVGLLNVLHHLGARRMSPAGLAREAIELEHDILHETVGCQDQFTCALGGLNYLEFGPQRSVSVRPITPGPEVLDEIDERMVIVYSGEQRISSVVAEPLIGNVKSQEKLFNATHELADKAYRILQAGSDLDEFGDMFRESWIIKSKLNYLSVTTPLQELHDRALSYGALGGKILGAGGGGFLMFWLKRGEREKFLSLMSDLVIVPTKLEASGTSIIFEDMASEAARQ